MDDGQLQLFGGGWTEQKLEMLRKYLCAYTTVLKKQPFRLAYIDAFAGTGYREMRSDLVGGQCLLFAELAQREPQEFLDGSARIALQVDPHFHRYVFVEKKPTRFRQLEKLKEEFPERAHAISLHQEDANRFLQELCARADWRRWRAVLFLDPFGMQVEWNTMEAVASTKAIDVWILFPLGVGVNRLLMRDPERIPQSWRARLNRLFGSDDWLDTFYRERVVHGFLGVERERYKHCTFETISDYYQARLRTIFPRVADNPRKLYNSTGNPLFELCFAAANPGTGGEIAVRIAQHILKG